MTPVVIGTYKDPTIDCSPCLDARTRRVRRGGNGLGWTATDNHLSVAGP